MARRTKNAETPPPGNPNLAALLTWLVPGAGHLLLGKPMFALGAFAVVEGLYLLGYALTDGMLFQYLQPELRSTFAGALTPEAGNLGALLLHMTKDPFGTPPFFPRPWPATMQLGVFLTALSGVANVALCVRAYADGAYAHERLARGVHPGTAVLFAWLVPGLGHWVQGRRVRGAAVFAMVVALLAAATVLAQSANLDRELHFYYWSGQFMAGSPSVVLELLLGPERLRAEIPYVDAGLVFGCLAGLLNVLAMMDAYTTAELRLARPAEPASDEESAEDAAAPEGLGAAS